MRRFPFNAPESTVTDYKTYSNRREFLQYCALTGALLPLTSGTSFAEIPNITKPSTYNTDEELTPLESVTSYNNFYEFSLDKEGPAKLATEFKTNPWTLSVDGECESPFTLGYEDLTTAFPLEERIYRLRCVEAWSMVIPWVGFELSALIKKANPTSKAKFVRFVTLKDPEQMPGQKPSVFGSSLPWPYVEGLRMDEAMNPLTILAVGLYGDLMPNQNGAPIRLVVPWKYGFKSIKSIVRIEFVEEMPATTWNAQNSREYGFFANVNPEVDHPRWSQAKERRIGDLFKTDTLPFNGYGEWVADLYTGMDLTRDF